MCVYVCRKEKDLKLGKAIFLVLLTLVTYVRKTFQFCSNSA